MGRRDTVAAFDPYHRWLGIPPEEQPPNHYRLLGLVQYESDPEVIENAANQRMAHLRSFQAGRNAADSQRLLNEVAAARVCLLNSGKKEAYDETLRQLETPPAVPPSPIEAPPPVAPSQSANLASRPTPPPIEVRGQETWLDAHLHGHAPPSTRRASRGAFFAVGGSVAALAVVIVIALVVRSGRSLEAMVVFDLAGANREDLRLSIDGMERAVPPSGPVEFVCKPGPHEVVAARPGYPPFETEITLGTRERLTLVPKWGQPTELVLTWPRADREGSKLFLDGHPEEHALADSASSDTIVLLVSPGSRIVRIERPGFAPFEVEVVAKFGESTEVVPEFAKADLPPEDTGLAQKPVSVQAPDTTNPFEPGKTGSAKQASAVDATSMTGQDPPPQVAPPRRESAPSLHPIPSPEEQADMLLRIDDVLGVDQAKTREEKAKMAQRLLAMSAESRGNPLELFGILDRGQQLAVAAGDVPVALKLVTAKGEAFDIDVLEEQATALAQIANSAVEASVVNLLIARGWEVLDAAIAAERYDVASQLIDAFHAEIRREPWRSHAGRIIQRRDELRAMAGETAAPTLEVVSLQSRGLPLPEGKAVQKGEWEDLLATMNPLRDVPRGRWQRQGTVITSVDPYSMLMFPVAVQGDYELEFQFTHASGAPQGLTVTIPVGARTCSLFLPYNARQDILQNVNGQPYIATVPRMPIGRPATVKISVTTQNAQKHINVLVNGGPYFQWQGAEDSLSGWGTAQMPRMNQPGLMVIREQYGIHAVRFRLLEGEARLIVGEGLPAQPYLFTGEVGHFEGTVFQDFAPEDAVLVGLRTIPGALGIGNLQPVYRTGAGQLQEGAWVGGTVQPDESAIAKDGYAIGALQFDTQNGYLKGVTVRFCRLTEEGWDLADTYDSSHLGQEGIDGQSVIETRGHVATGIHGLWNPGQISSLGLITEKPPEDRLWKLDANERSAYVTLLDLEPIQCTVGAMRYSRRLGIGTTDPEAWPIVDRDSLQCPEYIYAPAPSRLIWKLTPATMKSFSAIGYSVERRDVRFLVLVDGQIIHDSGEAGLAEIKVDLPPGDQLELQVQAVGSTADTESFWLYPRVHSRPESMVNSFVEKTSRGSMLVGKPLLSQTVAQRGKSHKILPPVYPVSGHCREFLYAHPPSRVVYRVPEGAKRFSAIAYCADSKAVRFRVSINGRPVYKSGTLGIERIQFALRQAKTIELWTDPLPEDRRTREDHAFWCFPRFYK